MKTVRIGIVGLGRLGQRHAQNLAFRVKGAELAAACSIVPEERDWARGNLNLEGVYEDFGSMLAHPGLDAVFIVSSSSVHAEQIAAALGKGLHVFSEKPMGTDLAQCRAVEAAVAARPDKVFLVGFVRRYDPSYAYAKAKIAEGAVGDVFLVRSQTADLDAYAPFQVKFVPTSGGIFMDMNVHDIDLARWFIGDEVDSVYAVGGSYVHPEFAALGDADNTEAVLRFRGGKLAVISVSRTSFHGHDTRTEIKGSKGSIRIGFSAEGSRAELFDRDGERRECVQDFYERFREAFLAEAQAFVDCVLEGRKPELSARDGTRATEVAFALTESFRTGAVVKLA